MFKVNHKDTVLVSLLLTVKMFHTLFLLLTLSRQMVGGIVFVVKNRPIAHSFLASIFYGNELF